MFHNPVSGWRQRLRTPAGLLLLLGGIAIFGLERYETFKIVSEFLPSWLRFVANPIVVAAIVFAGISLIFWEVHDVRKTEQEHVKRNLLTLAKESLIVFSVLVVLFLAVSCIGVIGRFVYLAHRKPSTAETAPAPASASASTSTTETSQSQPPAKSAGATTAPRSETTPATTGHRKKAKSTSADASTSDAGAIQAPKNLLPITKNTPEQCNSQEVLAETHKLWANRRALYPNEPPNKSACAVDAEFAKRGWDCSFGMTSTEIPSSRVGILVAGNNNTFDTTRASGTDMAMDVEGSGNQFHNTVAGGSTMQQVRCTPEFVPH